MTTGFSESSTPSSLEWAEPLGQGGRTCPTDGPSLDELFSQVGGNIWNSLALPMREPTTPEPCRSPRSSPVSCFVLHDQPHPSLSIETLLSTVKGSLWTVSEGYVRSANTGRCLNMNWVSVDPADPELPLLSQLFDIYRNAH